MKRNWWSAWYVYASRTDWKKSCTKNTLAYANNVDYDTGLIEKPNDPESTVKITFCDDYFTRPRLADVIKSGQSKVITNGDEWNLDKYVNKGYAVLHEMMHGDAITYTANGNRHIKDLQMRMRPIESELPENGKIPWSWYRVYCAMFTKILARVDDRNLGPYITSNADNLAQYALAKYVSGKIGGYPYLPLITWEQTGIPVGSWGTVFVTDTDGTLYVNMTTEETLNNDAGPEGVTASDTVLDCSDSDDGDCDTMDVVDVTALINDSEYPADYITQRNAWIATYNAQGGDPTTTYQPSDDFAYGDPSLECNSDQGYQTGTGSVDTKTAADAIGNVCTWWMGNKTTLNLQYYRASQAFQIPNSKNWL